MGGGPKQPDFNPMLGQNPAATLNARYATAAHQNYDPFQGMQPMAMGNNFQQALLQDQGSTMPQSMAPTPAPTQGGLGGNLMSARKNK